MSVFENVFVLLEKIGGRACYVAIVEYVDGWNVVVVVVVGDVVVVVVGGVVVVVVTGSVTAAANVSVRRECLFAKYIKT